MASRQSADEPAGGDRRHCRVGDRCALNASSWRACAAGGSGSSQLTGLTLHLGGYQLTSLPAEIGQLTSLEVLYLYGNQLTSLPAEIGQLTSLRS